MSARDDKAHRGIHVHSTALLSTFLSPFIHSLLFRLSFTSHKPPFSFSSSFSSSSWQAFVLLCCPDTFLNQGTERDRKRERRGRVWKDEKEKGERKWECQRCEVGSFFISLLWARGVSQQRESEGIKQRGTEMERWKNNQIMEETCVKRE